MEIYSIDSSIFVSGREPKDHYIKNCIQYSDIKSISQFQMKLSLLPLDLKMMNMCERTPFVPYYPDLRTLYKINSKKEIELINSGSEKGKSTIFRTKSIVLEIKDINGFRKTTGKK